MSTITLHGYKFNINDFSIIFCYTQDWLNGSIYYKGSKLTYDEHKNSKLEYLYENKHYLLKTKDEIRHLWLFSSLADPKLRTTNVDNLLYDKQISTPRVKRFDIVPSKAEDKITFAFQNHTIVLTLNNELIYTGNDITNDVTNFIHLLKINLSRYNTSIKTLAV